MSSAVLSRGEESPPLTCCDNTPSCSPEYYKLYLPQGPITGSLSTWGLPEPYPPSFPLGRSNIHCCRFLFLPSLGLCTSPCWTWGSCQPMAVWTYCVSVTHPNFVSSATLLRAPSAPSSQSLMEMLNRTGTSTDPWDTLLPSGLCLDLMPRGAAFWASFQFTSLSICPAHTLLILWKSYRTMAGVLLKFR